MVPSIPARTRLRATLESIAHQHEISVADMLSHAQQAYLVEARRHAAHVLRKEFRLSYTVIGRVLGGRHHTTIVHLLKCEPIMRDGDKPLEIPCPDLSGEWAI